MSVIYINLEKLSLNTATNELYTLLDAGTIPLKREILGNVIPFYELPSSVQVKSNLKLSSKAELALVYIKPLYIKDNFYNLYRTDSILLFVCWCMGSSVLKIVNETSTEASLAPGFTIQNEVLESNSIYCVCFIH